MEAASPGLGAQPPGSLSARLARIGLWTGGVVATLFVLNLIGVPIADWIRDLLKKVAEVPLWAVGAAAVLETLQTAFAALAWLAILRAAFPRAAVPFRLVLACYATAVALNDFLPANLGTWVMLVMFTTLIAGATFAAIFSGLVVQKIPFSVFNIAVYLYLFLTVSGSFSIKLGFVSDHEVLLITLVGGGIALIVLLARVFWRRLAKLRAELATGGAILTQPRTALVRLALPELASYLARLGIIAVFLAAYGIPVDFKTVASVTASNSISNSVSVTPGGVGVTQAMNTAALSGSTDSANAAAYSVSQQLIVSTWDVIFALVLVSWVFGWSGGRDLVQSSYGEAKVKSRDFRDRRASRRDAEEAAGR
ncbi:MAG: lysylphosphatidylglycerol synthase domain-containing protein [Solirubrobacterales bacterium]